MLIGALTGACVWRLNANTYSEGCAGFCQAYSLAEAQTQCVNVGYATCKAVNCQGQSCTLRASAELFASPSGENTWTLPASCYGTYKLIPWNEKRGGGEERALIEVSYTCTSIIYHRPVGEIWGIRSQEAIRWVEQVCHALLRYAFLSVIMHARTSLYRIQTTSIYYSKLDHMASNLNSRSWTFSAQLPAPSQFHILLIKSDPLLIRLVVDPFFSFQLPLAAHISSGGLVFQFPKQSCKVYQQIPTSFSKLPDKKPFYWSFNLICIFSATHARAIYVYMLWTTGGTSTGEESHSTGRDIFFSRMDPTRLHF